MVRARFNQAISTAVADEMRSDPTVVLLGEDIGAAGGPFKTSESLFAEFGPKRVRDTPIAEMGFTGAAVGAAVMGLKPIVEIMFMEFLGVALDQLVTEAAKYRYLSAGRVSVPMTVRCSIGSGLGFGCQHSQTLENWLTATPGLQVLVPSDVQSAYGLVRAAIRDPDPTVVLEPRALYGTRGDLITGEAGVFSIGRARILRPGAAATMVTLGQTTSIVLDACRQGDLDVDVIDLLTLVPWDRDTVFESVRRTGRLVVVEAAPYSGGWGHEIVSAVSSAEFASLKAPPLRITCPDVPVPYSKELEHRYLPDAEEVSGQMHRYLSSGRVPPPWWVREKVDFGV